MNETTPSSETEGAPARKPIFGVLSLATPTLAGLIILGAMVSEILAAVLFFLVLVVPFLFPACGLAFAVVAGIRRERWPVLWSLGLFINGAMLIFLALAPRDIGHF